MQLNRVKDRQLALELASRDIKISAADERASTTEAHLAEANARISESDARAKEAEAQMASANAASQEAVAKVAAAEARSAEASAKTEAFRLDIAKANESAAQANRIAEEERLARVKIENILGGWRLSKEGAARLTDKLKVYRGTQFEFFANPGESSFLAVLDKILMDSGWKRQAPSGGPIILGDKASILYISGLYAELSMDAVPKFGAALNVLIQGLGAEGIQMKPNVVKEGLVSPASLRIVIGKRE
ncbi:MAG: hypothetical protein NTY38_25425 [Acidobacteria bacterium]|nr:hypothetical protein [Acidobacteriota bacterium]